MNSDLRSILFAFLAGVMAFGTTASAQGNLLAFDVGEYDSELPIEITSTELVLDQDGGSAVFSGDVIIRQGPIIMTCNTVRVEYDANPSTGKEKITAIRMSEGVTFVSDNETVESERAIYSPTDGLLEMSGNVLIVQGISAISADRLDYSFVSGSGRVQGNVKTVLSLN